MSVQLNVFLRFGHEGGILSSTNHLGDNRPFMINQCHVKQGAARFHAERKLVLLGSGGHHL